MNTISIPENLLELSQQMEDAIRKIESTIQAHKDHPIHTRNHFNRKFSILLSFMGDVQVIIQRLHEQAEEKRLVEREGKKHWPHTKDGVLCDEHQVLMQRSSTLLARNQVDLKSLYIFSKIFFDQYGEFMDYILQVERRGIVIRTKNGKGDISISSLHGSLERYSGDDEFLKHFKDAIYKRLHALYVYVVEYRNSHVMHSGLDLWSDTWTLSNPDGSTRFLTGRSSSTPLELAFVIRNFLKDTSGYICGNINQILDSWEKPAVDDFPKRPWEEELPSES